MDAPSKTVILGPAGTGKTTKLIEEIKASLEYYHPSEIGFATFSREAAENIGARLAEELGYPDLKSAGFKWFGTIHSLAFKAMHMSGYKPKVAEKHHYADFCQQRKIKYHNQDTADFTKLMQKNEHNTLGNAIFQAINRARLTDHQDPEPLLPKIVKAKNGGQRGRATIMRLLVEWEQYKKEQGIIDYTDMLIHVVSNDFRPPIAALFVDEFQDLNPIQYRIFQQWQDGIEAVTIAGDDDQNIYEHVLGTESRHLIQEWENADRQILLDTNYRTPKPILAYGRKLIEKNKERVNKDIKATKQEGVIKKGLPSQVLSWINNINSNETFLILAPTNHMAINMSKVLTDRNIPHMRYGGKTLWDDNQIKHISSFLHHITHKNVALRREGYYTALATKKLLPRDTRKNIKEELRLIEQHYRDPKKYKEPACGLNITIEQFLGLYGPMMKWQPDPMETIVKELDISTARKKIIRKAYKEKKLFAEAHHCHLGTIHSSKGHQAEHVLLFTDLTKNFNEEASKNPEYMRRLFYTAINRASKSVLIVDRYFRTGYRYPLNTPRKEAVAA